MRSSECPDLALQVVLWVFQLLIVPYRGSPGRLAPGGRGWPGAHSVYSDDWSGKDT
jgi:hypothetical protein